MNYQNPELIDRLASEYVLGTLQGAARRRFEHLMRSNHAASDAIRRQVNAWQSKLMPLNHALQPVNPPPRVWAAIVQRLRLVPAPQAKTSWWNNLLLWRGATAAAGVVALLLAVNHGSPGKMDERYVAVLNNDKAEAVIVARYDATNQRLKLASLGSFAPPDKRTFELWMLPKGAAPISLGVLPTQGEATVALSANKLAQLQNSEGLAISIEPLGGSPTGAPTGPVVLSGKLRLS